MRASSRSHPKIRTQVLERDEIHGGHSFLTNGADGGQPREEEAAGGNSRPKTLAKVRKGGVGTTRAGGGSTNSFLLEHKPR